MALFVEGIRCVVCNQPIYEDQPRQAFPPFVSNECDPLGIFHDTVVHAVCFSNHPLMEQAQQRLKALTNARPPYVCRICHHPIRRATEVFPLGHIVDNHPLSEWNYAYFHTACLPRWEDLDDMYTYLDNAYEHGLWKGIAIQQLLTELNQARLDR